MNYFVGIDVASEKHQCCISNGKNDRSNIEIYSEFAFENNVAGFNLLLSELEKLSSPDNKIHIGLEATGVYGDNLTEFLMRKGFEATTFNPLIIKKSFQATTMRKTKTDKVDARFIAHHLAKSEQKPDAIALYHTSELKSLCRRRFLLVKQRSQEKNRINALITRLFPEYKDFFSDLFISTSVAILTKWPTAKDIASANLRALSSLMSKTSRGRFSTPKARELKELAKNSIGTYSFALALELQLSLEHISLLEQHILRYDNEIKKIMLEIDHPIITIPGIGFTIGAIILAEYGAISNFHSPAALLSFAGLEPSVNESGKFRASSGTMVKRGSPYLRWALHYAAGCCSRFCPVFNSYLNKKLSEGKHYNVALSHVAKKLLRVIFSLSRKNIPFDPLFCY